MGKHRATKRVSGHPLEELVALGRLEGAWERVRASHAGPGVDGVRAETFAKDLPGQLGALRNDVLQGRYQPQAYRCAYIPKPTGGSRCIVITAIRDRVLMSAAVETLHPPIEARLHDSAFAFRPKRGVQDALSRVASFSKAGMDYVLRTDIRRFFDEVPHNKLLEAVSTLGLRAPWIKLIRLWLGAPQIGRADAPDRGRGLPQGLPISPLLANLYLAPFDTAMEQHGFPMVRYADDIAIGLRAPDASETARDLLAAELGKRELALSAHKTSLVSFAEGFVYLGARFEGDQVLPAEVHPYEADLTPKIVHHKPQRSPIRGLPYVTFQTLYVQEQGSHVACRGGRFIVSHESVLILEVPVHLINQIYLFGRIHCTTYLLSYCLRRSVHLHFFSNYGEYYGVLRPPDGAAFALREAQYNLYRDKARHLAFARAIVKGKIHNSLGLLQRYARNRPARELARPIAECKALRQKIDHAKTLDQLRGFEGAAAAAYFRGFAHCLRGPMPFEGRKRHPPTDPINSLLSFGYTLLLHQVYAYACARGLDPAAGLLHEPGYGHPALASDMVEEFRAPIIDSLVLDCANNDIIRPDDFHLASGTPQPCLLQDDARKRYLHAFEEKLGQQHLHHDAGYPVDWRRIIDLQAARVRRYIEGASKRYDPYKLD